MSIMMTDYKSIALADPYFKSVPAASQSVNGLPVDVLGILQASKKLTVRQHVKILPKTCCSCPPCVVQENTYSVFAGLTMDSEGISISLSLSLSSLPVTNFFKFHYQHSNIFSPI